MERRRLLQLAAGVVAASAIGVGIGVTRRRAEEARASDTITGAWDALGPGAQWLLPNLVDARMVVPDRPHQREELVDAAHRAAIRRVRRFSVSTGTQRLRSGDPASSSPGLRVVAIGDSVTFGWGVDGAAAWPSRLAARLGANRPVEVINAGVPGQRLQTMARWVETQGGPLAPDVLVLVRRPQFEGQDPIADYRAVVGRMRAALPLTKVAVFLSPISRFDIHGQSVGDAETSSLKAALGDTPVEDLTSALRAAQGETGWGARLAGADVELVDLASGRVAERAPAPPNGLPASFYARMEADGAVREALFFDDGHPDAAGLDVLAQAVADGLGRLGWV